MFGPVNCDTGGWRMADGDGASVEGGTGVVAEGVMCASVRVTEQTRGEGGGGGDEGSRSRRGCKEKLGHAISFTTKWGRTLTHA
jgi:hypothetical protein